MRAHPASFRVHADEDILEMKSLELCLVSDCAIVFFSGHLLPIQLYLCCIWHYKRETGIWLINA